MKPEMKLAWTLSEDEEITPLRSMSVEELEGLLKQAWSFPDDNAAQKLHKRSSSELETNEAASSLIKRDMEKNEKPSPQELLKKAEAWGREIARMEKQALAVTPEGHAFDAERAKHRKEYFTNRAAHLQEHNALGHIDSKTGKNPAKILRVLRFMFGEGDPRGAARHYSYVEKKHREGKNAWNPMGGELTPLSEEKGAKPGFLGTYGKIEKKKEATSFHQVNEASKIPGRVMRAYDRVKGPIGAAAKAVGSKAHGAVKAVGSGISKIQDPILRGTAIGAATGGAGGAVSGFLDPKEDPVTGEKQRMKTMMRRGLSGAAGGAATGALFGSIGKTSSVSVQKLAAAMEKRAALGTGMAGIGSMAKNFVGQMKPIAQKAMGAAKPMMQNAMAKAAPMATKALGGKTMGQAAGMGAAGGAALGAAKGLVAPGRDPATGQPKSRIGAMARGAAGGAMVGGALGAGAKAALPSMQKAYKSATPGLHAPARTGANFAAQEHTAITPGFKSGVTQPIPQRR